MVNTSLKRRRTEDQLRGKVPKKEKKKVKKQKFYHSSSEDEGGARDAPLRGSSEEAEEPFQPTGVNATIPGQPDLSKQQKRKLAKHERQKTALPVPEPAEESSASDDETELPVSIAKATEKPQSKHKMTVPAKSALKKTAPIDHEAPFPSDDDDDAAQDSSEPEGDEFDVVDSESDVSEASSISETSTAAARKVRKRNDPEAFATSISRILNTKLTTTKRSEPILARSKDAQTANRELADSKLTEKARRQVVAERKAAQDKGRVKDVLGLNDPEVSTATTSAKEKELRRTAQKGVIKLFNAVRAAQVKGEQAEREAKEGNVVGLDKREEKVKEMSKQGFLDMITGGQGKKEASVEA